MAARQRDPVMAARSHGLRSRGESVAGQLFGVRGGFRRGPLDGEWRDRRSRTGRSADRRTVRALSLAQGTYLRRKKSISVTCWVRYVKIAAAREIGITVTVDSIA